MISSSKTMPTVRLSAAVVMQRTPLANRWASERWEPVAVELTIPEERTVARVDEPGCERWRYGGFEIELHRSEGEGYYLNLTAPEPRVFVMWRTLEPEARVPDGPPVAPFLVTLSYNEAARMLDGGEQVDSVPLPADMRAWLEPFTAAHYQPQPRGKVRRRDPLADDPSRPGPAVDAARRS